MAIRVWPIIARPSVEQHCDWHQCVSPYPVHHL